MAEAGWVRVDFTKSSLLAVNDDQIKKTDSNWSQLLRLYCGKSFKKSRISKKKQVKRIKPEIAILIDKRNKLLKENKEHKKCEIESINLFISNMEAEEKRNWIMENFKSFINNPESVNISQVWKTLKKMSPKNC